MGKYFFKFLVFFNIVTYSYAENLIMSIDPTFPPIEYVNNGKMAGVSIDVLNELQKRIGFTYTPKEIKYSETIDAIINNIADLTMFMTINDKRLEILDFSEPYYHASYVFVVSEDSDLRSDSSLSGKKIGIVHSVKALENIIAKNDAQVVHYNELSQLVLAIMMDKIDLGIIDSAVAGLVLSDKFNDKMSEVNKKQFAMVKEWGINKKIKVLKTMKKEGSKGTGIAFKKGKYIELIGKINKALRDMQTDGTLNRIFSTYGLE